jgi:pSer/pThr/pTyr-binding forkhead associated (FHA) protein/tetratricopeptide (TPR) repeat protein
MSWSIRISSNGSEQVFELSQGETFKIGRSDECDYVVHNDSKISRTHLIIVNDGNSLRLEVTGKYIPLTIKGEKFTSDAQINDTTQAKLGGLAIDFEFTDEFGEDMDDSNLPAIAGSNAPVLSDSHGYDDDEENTEVTAIGGSNMVPYVTIHDPRFPHNPEKLRLEGNFWVAGRDPKCSIQLEDSKISRQQFQIGSRESIFFIVDMGSSNGTLLNGVQITEGQETKLHSGDIIQVLDFQILFELKNPDVEEKLEQMSNLPIPSEGNSPFLQQPNNAVQPYSGNPGFTPNPNMGMPNTNDSEPQNLKEKWMALDKQQKMRIILIVAIVFIIGIVLTDSGDGDKAAPPTQVENPFDKLSKADQLFVEQTYKLAKIYLTEGKFSLAADEIRKLQEKVEYYKDSLEVFETAMEGQRRLEELRAAEEQEAAEREIKKKVKFNIQRCAELVNTETSEQEMRSCLFEAIELDPENPEIANLILQAQEIEDARMARIANAEEQARLARLGEGLFYKAEKTRKSGKIKLAIKQYNNHIKSKYPDPKGLKAKSRKIAGILNKKIDKEINSAIGEAQVLIDNGDLKGGILRVRRALALEPKSTKLLEFEQKHVTKLTKKLKVLYQESVLEEQLGNIESAKERWNKILEQDIKDGVYYKKARIKLKKYLGAI